MLKSVSLPQTAASGDLAQVLDLFLHELRTPVGVAQGYLRLLVENRLSDPADRERALAQSLEALGRIGRLCTTAGDYLSPPPVVLELYPAADLVEALPLACQGDPFAINVPMSPLIGDIRSLPAEPTAAAIAAVVRAALRNDPALTQVVQIGVHETDLVFTTGDSVVRGRLLGSDERGVFDPWRGGSGLQVPLALQRLAPTHLRLWTLADRASAVAIAMPLELPA
ncbi:MAG: hypothetical protein ABL961_12265 [Vicinamibacterales bacterium]